MATRTGITIEGLEQFKTRLSLTEREVFRPAASRAINRTTDRVKTLMRRSISKEMGVKQKSVGDRIRLTKTNPKNIDRGGIIRIRGSALNLIGFGARQTAKGVSAAPWGNRRVYPGSFIATIRGTRVVMTRRRRGGSRSPRLPIDALWGPAIVPTATSEKIQKERDDFLAEFLPDELDRQLEVLIRRKFG